MVGAVHCFAKCQRVVRWKEQEPSKGGTMKPTETFSSLEEQSQAVVQEIRRWRQAHPKATLAEIERAVDEQINQVRARMIEEIAQSSEEEWPLSEKICPQCGKRMVARGKHKRVLQTQGEQSVTLNRGYQSCSHCGYSFFPPG